MKNALAVLIVSFAMFNGKVPSATAGDALASVTAGSGGSHAVTYEIPASLTPEERRWFRVFQEGNIFSDGWQDISSEILARTPPEQQPAQKVALDNLGRKIGMEWCRPNSVRKVNSSMLSAWGDILRATARKDPQQLPRAIAYIDQKVDAALD